MKLESNIKRVKRPDKSFIFSVQEGDLFELNNIGNLIIDKIEEKLSENEIIDYLSKETGEDKNIIRNDLKEFISELKKRGFLTDE